MKIGDIDQDYETVKIDQVGVIDPLTGAVVFKDETVEFSMSGFSSEVAGFISNFLDKNTMFILGKGKELAISKEGSLKI